MCVNEALTEMVRVNLRTVVSFIGTFIGVICWGLCVVSIGPHTVDHLAAKSPEFLLQKLAGVP